MKILDCLVNGMQQSYGGNEWRKRNEAEAHTWSSVVNVVKSSISESNTFMHNCILCPSQLTSLLASFPLSHLLQTHISEILQIVNNFSKKINRALLGSLFKIS